MKNTPNVLALLLLPVLGGCCLGGSSLDDGELTTRLERIESELARLNDQLGKQLRSEQRPAPGKIHTINTEDAPVIGPADAPVTIVEFSDFECPFCATARPTLEKVLSEYPGQVRRVFKHNPMPFHRQALLAHKAAVAADEQGRFWEMYDRLFAAPDRLDYTSLTQHAQELQLDLEHFAAALNDPSTTAIIQEDRKEALDLHLLGVPTFFINGRLLAGVQPYEVWREHVEEALQASSPPH